MGAMKIYPWVAVVEVKARIELVNAGRRHGPGNVSRTIQKGLQFFVLRLTPEKPVGGRDVSRTFIPHSRSEGVLRAIGKRGSAAHCGCLAEAIPTTDDMQPLDRVER